jgi:hypothetical protein
MAVGTEQPQVLDAVVVVLTIDVIELDRDGLSEPF